MKNQKLILIIVIITILLIGLVSCEKEIITPIYPVEEPITLIIGYDDTSLIESIVKDTIINPVLVDSVGPVLANAFLYQDLNILYQGLNRNISYIVNPLKENNYYDFSMRRSIVFEDIDNSESIQSDDLDVIFKFRHNKEDVLNCSINFVNSGRMICSLTDPLIEPKLIYNDSASSKLILDISNSNLGNSFSNNILDTFLEDDIDNITFIMVSGDTYVYKFNFYKQQNFKTILAVATDN